MANTNYTQFQRRLERLEEEKKTEEQGQNVLLDFNRDDENDPNNIYLLCKVPPHSKWKMK